MLGTTMDIVNLTRVFPRYEVSSLRDVIRLAYHVYLGNILWITVSAPPSVALTTGSHGRDLVVFTHFGEFVTSPDRCQSPNAWIYRPLGRDRNLLNIFCFHFAFYLFIRRVMEGRGGEGGRGSSRWKRDGLVMGRCGGVLGGVVCLL